MAKKKKKKSAIPCDREHFINVLTPASKVEKLPNSDRLGLVSALWDQRE